MHPPHSNVQPPPQLAQAIQSYYTGNPVGNVPIPPPAVQSAISSGLRPFSADPDRIRVKSTKRYKKKNLLGDGFERQPTVYVLETGNPYFAQAIESLRISPAVHPINTARYSFPKNSLLIAPYEVRLPVLQDLKGQPLENVKCLFLGDFLQADPIIANHPGVSLATNSLE